MTTYQKTPLLYEIEAGKPIPAAKRAYFQEQLKYELYNHILSKFLERERAGTLTRAQLGRRIERSPAIVTRLLGSPANWTIATISDLLLGIAAEELVPTSRSVLDQPEHNSSAYDLLYADSVTYPAKKVSPQKPETAASGVTVRIENSSIWPKLNGAGQSITQNQSA